MKHAIFLPLSDPACVLVLLAAWACTPAKGDIINLESGNIDDTLGNADVALVNFYADWCRFSQMLHPIFEEASNIINEEYPDRNKVVFARVDCDQHSDIAQRYRISKYPTLKLFRNGMMMKREYRGQRSVTAIADYIRQQKSDPIRVVGDLEELKTIDRSKRTIIGFFESKESDNYRTFVKVSNILHDDCVFITALGDVSKPERFSGDNVIYRPIGVSMILVCGQEPFICDHKLYGEHISICLLVLRSCSSLFQFPFSALQPLTALFGYTNSQFILPPSPKRRMPAPRAKIATWIHSAIGSINFLHADCDKFRHPLLHIQKTPADCPVIAIDSFRHMYVFSDFKDLSISGKLKQFVLDLHSGKLHREFHHGPDPTDVAPGQQSQDFASSPPESSFQKLAPSEYRYTILKRDRDEL
ncbi:endoplasmic reticulum resident protein 44 [Anomaloglossus baeobatrachus]|uniref:endoplasmic reticulum resident protein 44 n=1 Tax=Anomaloglossus baeobatrachus TaxID=238106 RepID=UPI003F50B582